ncbi:dynamin family protein [Paraburkholderia sp.]|uniref:dynamin family protein n=1 Tax=Paraburkholderia sp. TaxID=1926495 RepID=UPI00239FCF65|nr:dynamin family protein [Paraburkholderia sp.]MDE1180939.1 dynamin family protein [Paraburkholderia sp.]
MKADASHEQRFITEVDAFAFGEREIEGEIRLLDDWLARLHADLTINRLTGPGLTAYSALTAQADAIDAMLDQRAHACSQRLTHTEPAQALADSLRDKAVLLVFGKFNAGKSSFCNFLADRFVAHGRLVQYFKIDAGEVVETSERFVEGATETTSRLQGVRLGDNLVLLDTPGLHSVTQENAALTARFIESADGVIWLTSSTSPGQVHELDELSRELHRNKPLLPVVTRSDVYDEDEIGGEIVKVLRNKSAQNRSLQEGDISARAEEKLVTMGIDVAQLKSPVSLSVHMARVLNETSAAMSEAGFERLYAALLAIIEPSLAYRRRKPAEIALHYIEENVLDVLRADVLPALAALAASSDAAIGRLERQQASIVDAVSRSVLPTLPALLDAHAATGDVTAICNSLSQAVLDSFREEAAQQLRDYAISTDAAIARIDMDDAMVFERIVVASPVDAGNAQQVVGVDYQRLHDALKKAIRASLIRLANDAAVQCRASIEQLAERAARLDNVLSLQAQGLNDLKTGLPAESA